MQLFFRFKIFLLRLFLFCFARAKLLLFFTNKLFNCMLNYHKNVVKEDIRQLSLSIRVEYASN